MKLIDLQIQKFFTYAGAALEFPPGVTVLVGANGSGKTAAGLEATCWLLWGKTTRGTIPDGDVVGGFEIGGTSYAVSRERKAKKTTLSLLDVGLGAGPTKDLTGQTVTETQAKIEEVFGTWDRFCAERVFSNRLARRFGSSTDKERKALVEAILGLERHESAAQVAREELGARKNKLQNARVKVAGAQAGHDEAKRAAARVAVADGPRSADLRARILDLEAAAKRAETASHDASRDVASTTDRAGKLQRALDQAAANVRALTESKLRLESSISKLRERAKASLAMGDCPVCFTPAKDIPRDRMTSHFAAEIGPLMAERDALGPKIATARAEAEEVQVDHRAALEDARKASGVEQAARREAARIAGDWHGAQVALAAAVAGEAATGAATEAVERTLLELNVERADEEEAEAACLVAEAAVKALGPRGARVRKMNGALARLTAEANEILARMPVDGTGPLRLSIRGSRELASGKEVDEVSVRVEGAGGPEGEYDGASDGERTRLDVAIMLGLARLSGPGEGLVIFDELFDPLDDAGLEAIVEVLVELAVRRQVIVTTHNPRFLDRLPASSVWRVARESGGPSTITRGDGAA